MLLLLLCVAPRATLYFAPVGWNSHSVSPCPISWCRFGFVGDSSLVVSSLDRWLLFALLMRRRRRRLCASIINPPSGMQLGGPSSSPALYGRANIDCSRVYSIFGGEIIHHFTQHAMLYNWLYSSSSDSSLTVCTGKRVRKHPTILQLQAGPPVISLFLFAQLSSPDYSSSFLYTQTRWQPFELCRFFPFFFFHLLF